MSQIWEMTRQVVLWPVRTYATKTTCIAKLQVSCLPNTAWGINNTNHRYTSEVLGGVSYLGWRYRSTWPATLFQVSPIALPFYLVRFPIFFMSLSLPFRVHFSSFVRTFCLLWYSSLRYLVLLLWCLFVSAHFISSPDVCYVKESGNVEKQQFE